jgi:hypothetical protein
MDPESGSRKGQWKGAALPAWRLDPDSLAMDSKKADSLPSIAATR